MFGLLVIHKVDRPPLENCVNEPSLSIASKLGAFGISSFLLIEPRTKIANYAFKSVLVHSFDGIVQGAEFFVVIVNFLDPLVKSPRLFISDKLPAQRFELLLLLPVVVLGAPLVHRCA